jgi:adenylate cyclase
MSSVVGQDYYADGIVEDIITSLSRMRWLMVIARNSSFTFKGKAVDIKQVGRELGARYVVEGSVRIDTNRVRITAQLIEAETGAHIWAERHDGTLGDIFAVQDEISDAIVAAIEPSIRSSELARIRNKPTDSLDAYDLYLRALSLMYALDRESYERAQGLLRRAIEIDPHYSEALSALADSIARQWLNGWITIGEIDARRREALALSRRAGVADPANGTALAVSAYAFTVMNGHFAEGAELAERAARAQPNSAYVRNLCGQVHVHNGDSDQAIVHFERARRLDPLDPRGYITLNGIAMAHFFAGRFAEAEQWGRRALTESAEWNVTRRFHAASLALLGRIEEAKAEVKELLLLQPNSSLARSRTSNFRHPRMYELYIEGLRLAGLPEA